MTDLDPLPPPPDPLLYALGDVRVTSRQIITPSGRCDLADAEIGTIDQLMMAKKTPPWAIILAIVFVWFFFLGLLFLLVKERYPIGLVNVTVKGPDFYHSSPVSVTGQQMVAGIHSKVTQIDTLIKKAKAVTQS